MRRLISMILAATVTLMLGVFSSAASASSPSAKAVLSASESAVEKAGSVQFVDSTTSGKLTQQLVGTISAPSASESITGNSSPFLVELIDGTVYVRGSATTLENALSLTANQAMPVADTWISVTSGDSAFSSLSGDLTLARALFDFTPYGPHIKVEQIKKIDGHRVIPVVGAPMPGVSKGAKGSAALFLSAKAPHLPVGGSLVLKKGKTVLKEVSIYKAWGRPVFLTAPSGAIPITSIING